MMPLQQKKKLKKRKQYIITKAVLIVYENTPSPRNRLMRADFNLAIRLGMFSLTRK